MTRRRLTRRQAWRISKLQEERLQRAQRKATRFEESVGDSRDLGPERTGMVVANYGPVLDVEGLEDGIVYRCAVRQNLGLPVVGDQVVWQAARDRNGIVVALVPRRTLLARPDPTGELKPLAANIDQILIVAAPLPRYDTGLIDQYLIAAESTAIQPVIVLNKVDLLQGTEMWNVESDFAPYRAIGYQVVQASSVARPGLDELTRLLTGKTSVFVGQSGVGKSSLVKGLLPDAEVRIGELADQTGLGRHTTSTTRLFHLDSGGHIIDSPGVREFRLWEMERTAIAMGFREFHPFLGQCRFRDCRHAGEPGCALEAAVGNGRISAARFASFQRIAAEVGGRQRPEWERA